MKIFALFLQVAKYRVSSQSILMNKSELTKHLRQMDHDPQKFDQIKNLCLVNHRNILDCTKVFQDHLHRTTFTLGYRVKIMQLMNSIMTNPNGRIYIRHFITRIRSFLYKNSMNLSLEGELSQKIVAMFANWKATSFFLATFFSSLKIAASAILSKQTFEANHFDKYNKTFTMTCRDIYRVKASSHLFKSVFLKSKANKDYEKIPNRFKDLLEMPREKKVEHAKELLKVCNGKIAALIEAINEEQEGCKQLANMLLFESNEISMNREMLKLDKNDQ